MVIHGCKNNPLEPPDNNKPDADFSANPRSISVGESVRFEDLSKGNPTSWYWNFGDGSSSSSQQPSHSFVKAGSYTITLTVSNENGNSFKTKDNYIAVSENPKPEPNIPIPEPIYPKENETLDNGCSTDIRKFVWSFNWTCCPNATDYEVIIKHSDLGTYKDVIVSSCSFSVSPTRSFPFRIYYSGWSWKVRAKVDGVWGEYCKEINFKVEPVNSDCDQRVVLYEHPNYQGTSRTIRVNTPNLDVDYINFADVASSVRIFNICGVYLYDYKDYGGQYLYLREDVSDLRSFNFNDRTESVKLNKSCDN